MKKYNSLLGFLMVLLVATGCSDFLEEENLSNANSEEYFTTESGYESLVNACYSRLRPIYKEPWLFTAGTDMYVEGRNTQPVGISEYRDLAPTTSEVESFYRNVYAAIQTCNEALYFNDKTEATANLNVLKGEVQFLRGYYYFLLVQQFGGVSIVTDRINAPVSQFERNSAEEVYDFIIAEMNEALDLVPENSSEFGRVNKRVVRHYLAKVYLTRGYEEFGTAADFEQAAALADEAIAGQSLTTSFEEVFTPGSEKNSEVLFSIQYDAVSMPNLSNSGSNQNYFFGPYMGGQGAAEGYPYRSYSLVPTMYVFDLFTENDTRFEGTFMINYYDRYYDYYDRADEREDLNIQYYYAPKWSLADTTAWRAADPAHRAETTIVPYSPEWEASTSTVLDNATPAVKKFDDPTAVFSNGGSSTRDVFLARLAETYLIAAEAYYQMGDAGTAAERINEVRRRAAKPGTESEMMITAADVTIDFILDERARELVGEYHRWFDLKRTGTLMERTREYNRDIKEWYSLGVDPFLGVDGNYKILRPIPQDALDLNDADIAQNPGY
ncbi:RagB/SusD family nutrient uptake outer membrane protein [Pontibacter silvestris]|uniref:RagB/SusD family nutrient uptake outer membrane protein n=1 Tax=Pontibacter silvestris TaxID=2305183 RepID=A0ABW4X0R2_9BACT|nr:RagB/SusD family nutrient uptake outer membrane protein [Pontibacter silvestris]MCC9135590.1 RagB/SusD family nutrient uptake outer membrane protein [Pontibacter silvestris]